MDQINDIKNIIGSLDQITDEKLDGDQVKNLLGDLQGAINQYQSDDESTIFTLYFDQTLEIEQLKELFLTVTGISVGSIWSDDQLFEDEDEADEDLFLSIDYDLDGFKTVVEVDLNWSEPKELLKRFGVASVGVVKMSWGDRILLVEEI